jgi:endonuclease YncB( thermonuclease family)
MAKRALVSAPAPRTFDELLRHVTAVLVTGRAEIEDAWVRTYHEIGRLINVYVLENRARADYGGQVFERLSERTGVSVRTLRECVQFQRCYPIRRKSAELGWCHYVLLCQVADPRERNQLTLEAERRGWKTGELKARVRALNAAIDIEAAAADENRVQPSRPHQPLVPQRGATGVCRVATVEGKRVVDLGFAEYFDLSEEQAGEFKDGALVTLDGGGRVTPAEGARKADLFNYRVELIRVVDGDTLWVRIYLRPRQWVKQKLRLRGLDCPELSTPEGRAAKRFVDGLVANTTSVVINTTKPDKYDRYLADVFLVGAADRSSEASAKEDELYLNNALLENGQAVRKDAWEFGDWEPDLLK